MIYLFVLVINMLPFLFINHKKIRRFVSNLNYLNSNQIKIKGKKNLIDAKIFAY